MRPYEALAEVYDRWTAENDYGRWAAYVHRHLADAEFSTVLDVCCGTGTMTRMLQDFGYEVTGVDRSKNMLDRASANVRPGTPLKLADLPCNRVVEDGAFDAATCSFDSVNHFVSDEALRGLFGFVAAALRPSGLFIFDVNTRRKLQDVFGSSHYGDDHGDFAYVWRNRYDAESKRIQFLITLFTRGEMGFARHEEVHEQRWFSHDELNAVAAEAGFSVLTVSDDYTTQPTAPDCLRETWVLQRDDDSRGSR